MSNLPQIYGAEQGAGEKRAGGRFAGLGIRIGPEVGGAGETSVAVGGQRREYAFNVGDAADILGVKQRAIQILCAKKWAAAGLAALQAPPEGGKPRWRISAAADPAFQPAPAPCLAPQGPAVDTHGLTDEQRAELDERVAIYKGWRAACREAIRSPWPISQEKATTQYLARMRVESAAAGRAFDLTYRTLRRWHRDYETKKRGIKGLIDARWAKATAAPADDPMLLDAANLYLDRNAMSQTLCWEAAKEKALKNGWRVWSLRTTSDYLNELPPALVKLRREGKKAFEDDAESYIERDYSGLAANALWNADTHPCDVICQAPGEVDQETGEVKPRHFRPNITAFQDCRSRMIVGWVIFEGAGNTDWILLALRRAVLAHGIPDACLTDNGDDYRSYAMQGETKKAWHKRRRENLFAKRHNEGFILDKRAGGVFAELEIKPKHAQVEHGQSKPIERAFGTLEGRFGVTWPTYCGNKPENKPEGLEARLKAGKAPTLEEFTAAFEQWVTNDYNARPHHGDAMDGKAPAQVFAETLQRKRTAEESRLNSLLMKQSRPVKVTQNGVMWNYLHYGKLAPELDPLLGQEVTLRMDRADASKVAVWTLEGKFVCWALVNGRLPIDAPVELVTEAIKEKRRDTRAITAAHEPRRRLHEDIPERMARAAAAPAAARQAAGQTPPPPPDAYAPAFRSPKQAEFAAMEAEKIMPLRRAAGAESMSMDVDAALEIFGRKEP